MNHITTKEYEKRMKTSYNEQLVQLGEKEVLAAEKEMGGLMALRQRLGDKKPLQGVNIAGCLHLTVQTAVLIETLAELGANVRWTTCNIFSTQDHAAEYLKEKGFPVWGKKGMTYAEYWEGVDAIFQFGEDSENGEPEYTTTILDDGGDATAYILYGALLEDMSFGELPKDSKIGYESVLPDFDANDELRAMKKQIDYRIANSPVWFIHQLNRLVGVSEETTTGVHRLRQLEELGTLPCAAINVNDAVTKSKFDNRYGCRESLVDGIRRATDIMISGKRALVCGYGDVGKGSAASLRGAGAIVEVTEIDPICALQAKMDGFNVVTMATALPYTDIYVTATGNKDVITLQHMQRMKDGAIIGNIGHFDNEIQVNALRKSNECKWENIKPQVDLITMPYGNQITLLSEGRLLNLGNATGHPSLVMSFSFTNQVMAQLMLVGKLEKCFPNLGYDENTYYSSSEDEDGDEGGMYKCLHNIPVCVDEYVAALHLDQLDIELTQLTQEQADYIGVDKFGPYKQPNYKY